MDIEDGKYGCEAFFGGLNSKGRHEALEHESIERVKIFGTLIGTSESGSWKDVYLLSN